MCVCAICLYAFNVLWGGPPINFRPPPHPFYFLFMTAHWTVHTATLHAFSALPKPGTAGTIPSGGIEYYSACRGRRRRAGKRKQTSFVDYNPLLPQDFQDSSAGASTVSLVDVRIRYQIFAYKFDINSLPPLMIQLIEYLFPSRLPH